MAYTSDVLKDLSQTPPAQIADPILYNELLSLHNAIEKLAQAVQELVQYNIDNP